MKKRILTTLLLTNCIWISGVYAQSDISNSVLITLANKDITVSEFENIYRKNNSPESNDPKSLDEYLTLFVNFKLKVKEAEELGYDTTAAFKNELSGYRKQLAQPYLTDNDLNEKLINEAYERLNSDIKAKHILVRVDANAGAKDTLDAYNKTMAYKKRIAKGESFDKIVDEIKALRSETILAEDLGYFTCFQMVYPFETAAYNTKPKTVSEIVRTRFGYHLIYVENKRPARGQISAAHIMVKTTEDLSEEQNAQAKTKVDEIYAKVKAGENFNELAKAYSDDKGSATKGGVLPWFGTGRMVAEFEDAAFSLEKNDDVSQPIKTKYGWHIIKRIDYKGLESFENMKTELKNKVARDGRAIMSRESLIKKIKEEYTININKKSLTEFYALVDESYFNGEWKNREAALKKENKLFSIEDKKYSNTDKVYTQKDFAEFLINSMRKQAIVNSKQYVDGVFEQVIDAACIQFEENNLEYKYPEFKALMQEYRDGILLFELMDKKVWSKAISDSSGLREYYDKNKTNFMWPQRVKASVYSCSNDDVYKKTLALVKKKAKKGYDDQFIKDEINKDSQLLLQIENGVFQKGDNDNVDKIEWKKQVSDKWSQDGKIVFVEITEVIPTQPKELFECKGLVTAEYQNYLETKWIEELKNKYEVHINREILSKITPN